MGITMNKEKMKALAAEIAKDLKTPEEKRGQSTKRKSTKTNRSF